jgi:hypothetical protein
MVRQVLLSQRFSSTGRTLGLDERTATKAAARLPVSVLTAETIRDEIAGLDPPTRFRTRI